MGWLSPGLRFGNPGLELANAFSVIHFLTNFKGSIHFCAKPTLDKGELNAHSLAVCDLSGNVVNF
jgi:hypothetical protein